MALDANEIRRAYKRKWARMNPEKVRAQQQRYWAKRAAKAAAAEEPEAKPFRAKDYLKGGD